MKDLVKLVVFVPLSHTGQVRDAIGKAGGGKIGNYSFCSFSTRGLGRFKPETGASPFIGEVGKPETVEEEKIEITCEKSQLKQLIAVIEKAHPYEEVAIDVYPLLDIKND